jgi:hypothetical protein
MRAEVVPVAIGSSLLLSSVIENLKLIDAAIALQRDYSASWRQSARTAANAY